MHWIVKLNGHRGRKTLCEYFCKDRPILRVIIEYFRTVRLCWLFRPTFIQANIDTSIPESFLTHEAGLPLCWVQVTAAAREHSSPFQVVLGHWSRSGSSPWQWTANQWSLACWRRNKGTARARPDTLRGDRWAHRLFVQNKTNISLMLRLDLLNA